MKQFHAEFADPTGFDVVVNTAALGIDGASGVVRHALTLCGATARTAALV